MQFIILLPLVVLYSGACVFAANARGRRPIVVASMEADTAAAGHAAAALNNGVLSLPKGFRPQYAPKNPMRYPRPQLRVAGAAESPWKPLFQTVSSTHPVTNIPVALDRIYVTDDSESLENGVILESVVYGMWKPDHPVQPAAIFEPSSTERAPNSAETISYKHPGGLVEAINERIPTIMEKSIYPATRYNHHTEDESEAGMAASGRPQLPPAPADTYPSANVDVINVNISDPKLLAVATQINHSTETTSMTPIRRTTVVEEDMWTPMRETPNENEDNRTDEERRQDLSNMPPMNWPVDFTASPPRDDEPATEQPTSTNATELAELELGNYSFNGDSAEMPQLFEEVNIPESLLPQLPQNIKTMGTAYENYNSEKPQICVPFTVQEQSLTDDSVLIDLERVYCFPLPLLPADATPAANNSYAATISNTSMEFDAVNGARSSIAPTQSLGIAVGSLVLRFMLT